VQADGIVIATGARARQQPTLAGLSNVFTLPTLADAQSLAPGRRSVPAPAASAPAAASVLS
jgi:NADPH-dependent 2,4-dienoyl-CoA reductase/sulfur reductase-like enzyme